MKYLLFKTPLSIFPISAKTKVFIKGITLNVLCAQDEIDENKFNSLIQEHVIGTRLIQMYMDTAVTSEILHFSFDLINDLVQKKELDTIYLTDINKQAQLISKTFKCLCSASQIIEFRRQRHPIKNKLKMINILK